MVKFFYIREPSKNTLNQTTLETLQRLVQNGQLDSKVLVQELKRHRGSPVACVAYEKPSIDGNVKFSIATVFGGSEYYWLKPADTFNRQRAKEITLARLRNPAKTHNVSLGAIAQGSKVSSLHVMRQVLTAVVNDTNTPHRTRKAARYMLSMSDAVIMAES